MKKYALMTALALVLAAPTLAWSQTAPTGAPPSGSPPGAPPSSSMGGGMGGQENGEKFAEHKAEILRRIDQHLEEVVQRKHCVEAATDPQALRACMPEMGGQHGGMGGGGMQGGGMQHGGMGGQPPAGEQSGPGGAQ